MKPDSVYIKLNDDIYLFVGEFELRIDDIGTGEDDFEWIPASTDMNSSHRIGIRNSDGGNFKRMKKFDGYEFEIPEKYRKSIIKKTLSDKKR